jgi:FKBP-type peptidyl-prolyl cis-trans isomerase
MFKRIITLFAAAALFSACDSKVELVDGVKIQFFQHDDKAAKLKDGDVLTFHVVIKNHADSVLQDTYKDGNPTKALIQPVQGFKGSFENGLRQLAAGDSATILVPIDSLMTQTQGPLPPFLKKGTDLKYTVKILKVQSRAEFEKEMNVEAAKGKAEADKRLAEEPAAIAAFIKKSGKTFQQTGTGLYYSIQSTGAGESPKMGETWIVSYRGTFLDGKEFDKGNEVPMPLGQMIPGFNEALTLVKPGGQAIFVIPSAIAYGSEQRGPIPANSVLVFEVKLHAKK